MTLGKPWTVRWRHILSRLRLVSDGPGQQVLLQELVQRATTAERPLVLAFANAHALNLAARDELFAQHLAQADVLLRDGAGVAMLLRWQRRVPGLNLNGTDFIPRLLHACNGLPVAVIGTRAPYLEQGAAVVGTQFMPHSRMVAIDGFQATERYLALLRSHRPQVLLLAMGMPRQEALAQALRQALDFPCLIICGGAIVDFLGGKTSRAPVGWRRIGLEWVWRLGQEPLRLFRRYVIGNPAFLLRAAWLSRPGPSAAAQKPRP